MSRAVEFGLSAFNGVVAGSSPVRHESVCSAVGSAPLPRFVPRLTHICTGLEIVGYRRLLPYCHKLVQYYLSSGSG